MTERVHFGSKMKSKWGKSYFRTATVFPKSMTLASSLKVSAAQKPIIKANEVKLKGLLARQEKALKQLLKEEDLYERLETFYDLNNKIRSDGRTGNKFRLTYEKKTEYKNRLYTAKMKVRASASKLLLIDAQIRQLVAETKTLLKAKG